MLLVVVGLAVLHSVRKALKHPSGNVWFQPIAFACYIPGLPLIWLLGLQPTATFDYCGLIVPLFVPQAEFSKRDILTASFHTSSCNRQALHPGTRSNGL